MKTEELMIDDFVNFHLEIFSTDYEGIETVHDEVLEIGKVSALNSIGNVWVIDSEGEEHQVTKDEIEPIPLTSELLEKNGFNRLDQIASIEPYYWFFSDKETEVKIKAFNTIFKGLLVECVNPVNNATTYKQCEFVHEFQHALRLCEIEKEIVL
jgi:hypothetical protein